MSTLKDRIQTILDAGFGEAQLARMAGVTTAAVSHWKKPDKPDATVSAKTALALERGTGFRAEWIISGRLPEKITVAMSSPTIAGLQNVADSMQTLPVVEWGKGAEMLSVRNEVLVRDGQFEGYTAPGMQSARAKFFVVPDDAMAPDILQGEFVAMDPEPLPVRGDYVLIRRASTGELMLRQYRPLDANEFNAVPLNQRLYDPLNSRQHGLELLAVLVGHWSGRRSDRI